MLVLSLQGGSNYVCRVLGTLPGRSNSCLSVWVFCACGSIAATWYLPDGPGSPTWSKRLGRPGTRQFKRVSQYFAHSTPCTQPRINSWTNGRGSIQIPSCLTCPKSTTNPTHSIALFDPQNLLATFKSSLLFPDCVDKYGTNTLRAPIPLLGSPTPCFQRDIVP